MVEEESFGEREGCEGGVRLEKKKRANGKNRCGGNGSVRFVVK